MSADVCHCGKLTDDHTLRELREHHPAQRLNLPYEEVPDGPAWRSADSYGPLAGAVVVGSAAIPVPPDLGLPKALPALAFTFIGQDGLTEVAKTLLVLDDDHMRDVRRLVGQAVDGAIRAARRHR